MEQYLYPTMLNMLPSNLLTTMAVAYLKLDAFPYYLRIFHMELPPSFGSVVGFLILVYRVTVLSTLIYEIGRFCVEFSIITIWTYQLYEFYLAFLHKLTYLKSPHVYLTLFRRLEVCHNAISPYINSLYIVTFANCQISIVLFMWLTLRTFHIAPIALYFCFPIAAMIICGMAMIMINVLGTTISNRSIELLEEWKAKKHSKLVRKEMTAKRSLAFSYGPQMKIEAATTLTFLDTALDNLGNAVLLY